VLIRRRQKFYHDDIVAYQHARVNWEQRIRATAIEGESRRAARVRETCVETARCNNNNNNNNDSNSIDARARAHMDVSRRDYSPVDWILGVFSEIPLDYLSMVVGSCENLPFSKLAPCAFSTIARRDCILHFPAMNTGSA